MSMRTPLSAALLLALFPAAACGQSAADRAHLDAMAHQHAGETPAANASALPPAVPVVGDTVVYGTVDGQPARGYLSRPRDAAADAHLPGIIAIHEWWGLNDNIRMMADRLAGEGYQVLAVDLYGRAATTPEQARQYMGEVMANPARGSAHLSAAAAYLADTRHAPKLGIVGWCFGGGWSLEGALQMPERIDAAVMYYGRPVTDRDRLARLDAPLLGLFGGADQGIPVATVRQMESTLRDLGKDVTIHVYDGAGHAFANPSGQSYNAPAATDAWQRTTAFFAQHLHG